MKRILCSLATLLALTVPAQANPFEGKVHLEALPGWRMTDGSHMAAIRLTLAPGWKTYWRAPGDAGIPPLMDFAGSRNLSGVAPLWPTPIVFSQSGMRSVGYKNQVILPLRVLPKTKGKDVRLNARLQIGICNDVCVPVELDFAIALPTDQTRPDGAIAAALADRPATASEARVSHVSCTIAPTADGLSLRAEMRLPRQGGREEVVIETADPQVWVAEAKVTRQGNSLIAATELVHIDGGAFALDRSGLRLTVLGQGGAVDIQGCPAP